MGADVAQRTENDMVCPFLYCFVLSQCIVSLSVLKSYFTELARLEEISTKFDHIHKLHKSELGFLERGVPA